ncbi:serine hydrolase domain-containing protein [Psychromicrobium lacuslunae]|uniref:serine hydrolase domain-containing protein n=1 Tax=Psychromicrobium lacuslunae TaxID=1618207 RepID=UPI0006983BB9|nr:serine hydrolase domain-containing protein [Psychromicrobium lacuslunae]
MNPLRSTIETLLQAAVADGVTPSAVCAVALDNEVLVPVVVGDAVRYGADGTELPVESRIKATVETQYDLASVTKIFTTLTALSLVDEGLLQLSEPLGRHLPQYRSAAKGRVTLRHLLTHTSGLPALWEGWREALETGRGFDREALIGDLLELELLHEPGKHFEYSCAGFNTVMALCELITGKAWAELVQERVLDQLSAAQLSGAPVLEQCAATEYQPELGRGMIRGIVHDEAAWALSGGTASSLSGNAGMFGDASSLLSLGEALRTGLASILSPELAEEMWRPQVSTEVISSSGIDFGHGLGLRIAQRSWVGDHPQARGHNGFTGTSLLVDKSIGLSVVLLTNRVHPRRELSDVQALRRAISDACYQHSARSNTISEEAYGTQL